MTKSVFNDSHKVTHKLGDRFEISDLCNAKKISAQLWGDCATDLQGCGCTRIERQLIEREL